MSISGAGIVSIFGGGCGAVVVVETFGGGFVVVVLGLGDASVTTGADVVVDAPISTGGIVVAVEVAVAAGSDVVVDVVVVDEEVVGCVTVCGGAVGGGGGCVVGVVGGGAVVGVGEVIDGGASRSTGDPAARIGPAWTVDGAIDEMHRNSRTKVVAAAALFPIEFPSAHRTCRAVADAESNRPPSDRGGDGAGALARAAPLQRSASASPPRSRTVIQSLGVERGGRR